MYDMALLGGTNRRQSPRLRLNTGLNQYFGNEERFGLALNVSESGLSIRRPVDVVTPLTGVVALELELPGTGEVIWASAQPRFQSTMPGFELSGLHFLSMASKHQRLIRDYVRERHARLVRLLTPRTVLHSRFGALVS
jgi:hypothetical protein